MAGSYRQADSDPGERRLYSECDLPRIAVDSAALLTLFLKLVFSKVCIN